jgi:putative mRNA 3-end processing factor
MRFDFYGGAREVGRSCIAIDRKYMLDCGLKISEEGSEYPLESDFQDYKAVFISHGHLDHIGALPLFNKKGLRCPIYCNIMTKDTTRMLLRDSFHIELLENQAPEYTKDHIFNVLDLMEHRPYDREWEAPGCKARLAYAGHIPGSAIIIIDYNGKRIAYTGDINTLPTRLLDGAKPNFGKVDILICESTYGDRDHPPRQQTEDEFLDKVEEVIQRGGSVLIPAFAVGRSQEILMVLNKRKLGVPIILDGMAKQVTSLYLKRPEYIRSGKELNAALRKVTLVKSKDERKRLIKEQGIFVTTSGMLDGGPVIDYLGGMYFDEKSAILLTGYQTVDTNGRLLLEQGRVYLDGNRIRVKCEVHKYDFSAHDGQKETISLVNSMSPKHLILVHGDEPSIDSLSQKFKGIQVHTPRVGETIEVGD